MTEWVSARGACDLLAASGITRSAGRRLLATGLAGDPIDTPSATLFDVGRVRALLTWPPVRDLPEPSDRALLVLRVAPESTPDVWRNLGKASALVALHLRSIAERVHGLPTVVTTCGFVRAGFEVTDARPTSPGVVTLTSRPAGEWFAAFDQHRLHSAAGNPWQLWVLQAP